MTIVFNAVDKVEFLHIWIRADSMVIDKSGWCNFKIYKTQIKKEVKASLLSRIKLYLLKIKNGTSRTK